APPPAVSVARPIVRDVVEWTDFIGRFEAVDAVDIRARVAGFLDAVHFRDGALVKAGELLFTIDQRPYRAALQEAEADLASAVARRDYAQGDLGRADSLRRGGNIAEQTVDQRRQNLLTSRADARRAEAALARARLDLEFTEIRAPITGRMSRRLVSAGSLVAANDTLLANIVSLDPIQFYFDADERSYLAYLRAGAAGVGDVLVALADESDAGRRGRIDFIDNRLDQASGTMRGRAVFANPDLSLVPGLFGRLRFPAARTARAVLVPDEAIAADQDRRIVYVVDGESRAAARQVRPGPRVDGYRVVREGLAGDETIVVNGLARVQPGARIQPRPTELPAQRQQAARP
ncbi:MAG: efflux RND transporter periplasmic adaptor subunit, partial [Alphaproteobacteria bacterium]|nr:efflux RND transporter periplasmic adaptor subunit [Alphaproteobacteria bacterium]